jgi:hypothetical protein
MLKKNGSSYFNFKSDLEVKEDSLKHQLVEAFWTSKTGQALRQTKTGLKAKKSKLQSLISPLKEKDEKEIFKEEEEKFNNEREFY